MPLRMSPPMPRVSQVNAWARGPQRSAFKTATTTANFTAEKYELARKSRGAREPR